MCHVLVRVPTSEEYPVMNVSHAAAVILYFLREIERVQEDDEIATFRDIEVTLSNLVEMLRMVQYPEHRIKRTVVIFRRILGRAGVKKYEVHSLNAIFRKTVSYIKRMNRI